MDDNDYIDNDGFLHCSDLTNYIINNPTFFLN